MSKVLAVVITKDRVEPECLESVLNQTHPDVAWLISGKRPQFEDENPTARLYLNCADNREAARKMALASDADYFLFLDSDIVLPTYAVAEFVTQAQNGKHIIGGWYPILGDARNRWVCGNWVADNVFVNCKCPEPSLIRVDVVGIGCMFISRQALSDLPFEPGVNLECLNEYGRRMLLGECGIFGNAAAEKGYAMYMDGEIVCRHLTRAELEPVA